MSILMSSNIYRHLGNSVKTGFFFHVIPFHWDNENNLLRCADCYTLRFSKPFKSWSKFTGWDFVKCIYLLHQLCLLHGFIRIADGPISPDTYRHYAQQVLAFVGFSIPCAFQIGITVLGREVVFFSNQLLRFCEHIQEVYAKQNAPFPPWQKECEVMMRLVAPFGVLAPVISGFQLLQQPELNIYFTSVIPSEYVPGWSLTAFISAVIFSVIIFATWTCILIFVQIVVLFMYISNFLLKELRPNAVSCYTTDYFRQPQSLVLTYRSLECLYNRYNGICRDQVTVVLNNVLICFAVLCNCVIIRFHKIVSLDVLALFVMTSVLLTLSIYLSYMKLGKVNETSKNLLKSWAKFPKLTDRNKLLMSKYLKSFKPLRIEMGNFGYYNQMKSIKTLGKLVVYTARFMLMTKE